MQFAERPEGLHSSARYLRTQRQHHHTETIFQLEANAWPYIRPYTPERSPCDLSTSPVMNSAETSYLRGRSAFRMLYE